jgi:DNA segregation ATPase FtsK/SpoIIIE, S-DNA-T family
MATARAKATRRPVSRPKTQRSRRRGTSSTRPSRFWSELGAVACVAFAVFFAFVLYLGWHGGIVGAGLTGALRYLIGLLTYGVPLLLMYAAIVLAAGPDRRPLPAATAGVVVVCVAFLLAAAADSFGVFAGVRPAHLFAADWMRQHGGVVGETLWAGLHYLLGRIGTDVLVLATAIAGILLVTGSSLGAWARHSRRGVSAAGRLARGMATDSARTLADRRRASGEALQARRAARDVDDQARTVALRSESATEYLPGISVHRPHLVDARQETPELYANRSDETTPLSPPPAAAPERAASPRDQLSLAEVADPEEDGAAAFARSTVRVWALPDSGLLRRLGSGEGEATATIDEISRRLVTTLGSFGVTAQVINTVTGPRVTRYELQLAPGTKVSRVASLKADLSYSLAATDVRVLAPIPGKTAVGVEVPNMRPSFVALGDVYGPFTSTASPLAFWLGKDITGKAVLADLQKMVHLLVAGATGSGKSACINALLTSILLRATPEQVRTILIDPKKVELSAFDGIPHLLTPVVTDMHKASNALMNVVHEVTRRYDLMMAAGASKLRDLNRLREREGERPLPYILLVIDELADLMMVAPNDVENAITRLGQIGRAAGVHMVVATQRPSVDVITGLIKANIPYRIAFAVASQTDSRVILDQGGAETLLGEGDMLFGPSGSARMLRVQGAYVDPAEIKLITSHWRAQAHPDLHEEMLERPGSGPNGEEGQVGDLEDVLLPDAVTTVVTTGAASVALLQRRLRVGYARAGRLIDLMEERGIISGFDGSKARKVLIDEGDVPRVLAQLGSPASGGHGDPPPLPLTDGPEGIDPEPLVG